MSQSRPRQHRLLLSVEQLESREVLSATVSLSGSALLIRGDAKNDRAIVVQRGNDIVVSHDGVKESFRRTEVREIRFVGGAGNDYFRNDTSVRSVARGGLGNDTLIGGSGRDDLNGDRGNDLCDGRAGDDSIDGGAGNDRLRGGDGNDHLRDAGAHDSIDGGHGLDDINGHQETEPGRHGADG